jgi:predicted small lipoprotein YifL
MSGQGLLGTNCTVWTAGVPPACGRDGRGPGNAARRSRFDNFPAGPRIARVLALLLVVLVLAGCGKKGTPQPPPDEPNTFPRTYPSA